GRSGNSRKRQTVGNRRSVVGAWMEGVESADGEALLPALRNVNERSSEVFHLDFRDHHLVIVRIQDYSMAVRIPIIHYSPTMRGRRLRFPCLALQYETVRGRETLLRCQTADCLFGGRCDDHDLFSLR